MFPNASNRAVVVVAQLRIAQHAVGRQNLPQPFVGARVRFAGPQVRVAPAQLAPVGMGYFGLRCRGRNAKDCVEVNHGVAPRLS